MVLLCATTNLDKFGIGQQTLAPFGIELEQVVLEIDEVQHEESSYIAKDKAQKAFDAIGKPVVVTDDSWAISALGGFPGPYMKSINHWFTPEDFIKLMAGQKDRQIALHQLIAYCDGNQTLVFNAEIVGEITQEPHGTYGPSIMKVVAFPEDEGKTISEMYDHEGATRTAAQLAQRGSAWREFGAWYKEYHK